MSKKCLLILIMAIFAVSPVHSQNTETPESDDQPRIAFVSDRTGFHQLYTMNVDGTNLTQMTDVDFGRGIKSIDCSPIDDRIVIGDATTIYVFDVNAHTFDAVVNFGSDPSWSPDGTEFAYSSGQDGNNDIFRIAVNNPTPVNLTNQVGGDRDPDWSPDGSKIVFSSTSEDEYGIFTMNYDGTAKTRLTTSSSFQYMAQWSPDGSKIVFVQGNGQDANIYTMSASGTNLTQLTGPDTIDWLPRWSPDGSKITFTSERDGNGEIYVIDADGSNLMRLTNDSALDFSPCWLTEDTTVPVINATVGQTPAPTNADTTAQ